MTRRRILIPLDGSDFSREVLGYVRSLFPPEQYELVLMRVDERQQGHVGRPPRIVSPDTYMTGYDSARDLEFTLHPVYESQEVDAAIGALTDALRAEAEPLEVEGYTVYEVVHFGEPAHAIIQYAAENPVDLIAMTTHGRSGLRRITAGSVATQVLQHSPVPVILYRPQELHSAPVVMQSEYRANGHPGA
jgi:nucleotide-binding universal stress UspA family protein